MSKLSDNKLNKLSSMSSQGGFWYITKQNLIFRDLCFIAKILEKWGDRNNENYQTFFDNNKGLPEFGGFPPLTAHRATKNCEYIGLIRPSDKYSSQSLTPFYFSLKELCNGDFNKLSLYPEIIDKQLERIFIDSHNKSLYTESFQICPFMFLFKILLLIGDITKSYKISTSEFKLFVATAQNWYDYFEVTESILRYRNDDDFRLKSDANSYKVADVRYNILAQNHSQLEVTKNEISIKENQVNNIRRKVAEYELSDTIQSSDDMYSTSSSFISESPQQIYYGAPGTGKSHEIKKQTEGKEVIRTTFHPDSDYSTFVGAYKPTMKPVLDQYKAVAGKDEDIAYEFIPQAFLQAYIAAWNNQEENVFLVIEEINRGNCAQIFGDLFQLLDRDNEGYSEYPIKADRDLAKYLSGKDEYGNDVLVNKDGIKDGKLKLPKNLYIWATMNTSDQSLFPIDSAFKRRWDWEYMPIGYKNNNWTIEIGEKKYNWVEFQHKINESIYAVDNSEDKQLGDYFVNADRTGNKISADTFLNKILFYIWNDVCKDDPDQIFQWIDDKQPKSIKFSEFFEGDRDTKLQGFMAFHKVPAIGESTNADNSNDKQNSIPAEDDNNVNS